MPEHMVQRGKREVWYAECRYMGVRIRDCLETTDRRLAERRLAELKFAVEGGDYQNWRKRFDESALEYEEKLLSKKSEHSKERYGLIVKKHLKPFLLANAWEKSTKTWWLNISSIGRNQERNQVR